MNRWTAEEQEFMDYIDGVASELPGGHYLSCGGFGLLLAKGDPIAFNLGFSDWKAAQEYEREEVTA